MFDNLISPQKNLHSTAYVEKAIRAFELVIHNCRTRMLRICDGLLILISIGLDPNYELRASPSSAWKAPNWCDL